MIQVLRQGLLKMHVHTHIGCAHVRIAQHRQRNVQSPDLCLRDAAP